MQRANKPNPHPFVPDIEFADAILPLVLASFNVAGYPGGNIVHMADKIIIEARHPKKGDLYVTIGNVTDADNQPNQHRWAIPNRSSWRRSLAHLQQKLFQGDVPAALNPDIHELTAHVTL